MIEYEWLYLQHEVATTQSGKPTHMAEGTGERRLIKPRRMFRVILYIDYLQFYNVEESETRWLQASGRHVRSIIEHEARLWIAVGTAAIIREDAHWRNHGCCRRQDQ